MRHLLVLAAAAAATLVPATALAGVIKVVPGEGNPIQAAFDAAQDGDTILLTKGEYPAGATLSGKTDITIRGAGKPLIQGVAEFDVGLGFTEVEGLTVKGVEFTGLYRALVTADCTDVRILGCRFEDSYSSAIEDTTSAGYRIQGCTIDGAALSGIQLSKFQQVPGTSGVVVKGNTVLDIPDVAIDIAGTAPIVQGNRIVSGGSIGIRILGSGSAGAIVRSNRIQGPSNGIVVVGIGHTISGNRVTGCQSVGILVYANGSVFEKNTIEDSLGYGFLVDGATNEFVKNRVSGSGAKDLGSYPPESANTYEKNLLSTTEFNIPIPDPL